MLGLTLEEPTDRVMSTVQGEEAEPHVLAGLHMLSGCGSSHAYLLFCALARAEVRTMHNNKDEAIDKVPGGRMFVNMATPHFDSRMFISYRDSQKLKDLRHLGNRSRPFQPCPH